MGGFEINLKSKQTPLIGSHVERANPIKGALERGASVIQINLSAPQSWRAPVLRGDEEEIISSGLSVFVHAPYLVNPASINPLLREKSRVCLQQQTKAAAAVGAKGLVVHGGHPTGSGKIEDGIAGWLEVLEGWEPEVPILIENTAGGSAAVARQIGALASLFDALRSAGHDAGFTLDTCHAHAGGMDPNDIIERCLSATGRLDLIHLNDSKDEFGSGRDRHENLGRGKIDPAWLIEVIKDSNVPVVVETPNGVMAMCEDVDWVRARI
jgi:deoxyribonuclease-4